MLSSFTLTRFPFHNHTHVHTCMCAHTHTSKSESWTTNYNRIPENFMGNRWAKNQLLEKIGDREVSRKKTTLFERMTYEVWGGKLEGEHWRERKQHGRRLQGVEGLERFCGPEHWGRKAGRQNGLWRASGRTDAPLCGPSPGAAVPAWAVSSVRWQASVGS